MTDEGLPADRLNRILTAVETIKESLGVLARKQQVDRKGYKTDSDTRDHEACRYGSNRLENRVIRSHCLTILKASAAI